MKYRIYSKHLYYEIELNGKYTILCGNSGDGKTTLYDLIDAYASSAGTIHIDEFTKGVWRPTAKAFFALPDLYVTDVLVPVSEGAVIIVDESADLLHLHNAGTVFEKNKHQFLIITRSELDLDYLPVPVEGIFHLRNEGKKHFFERDYTVKYEKRFGIQDVIVTEDSRSGCKIFKEFFPNIPVMPAHSKSEIIKTLENLSIKYQNILAVYDAAAFGMQIKNFSEYVKNDRRNISVLDWYSFEHHVLSQPPFNIWINPETLDYTFESLELAATKKLASIVKYPEDKSSIRPCFTKQSYCKKCNRISYCKYAHDRFDLGINIAKSYSVGKINEMNIF